MRRDIIIIIIVSVENVKFHPSLWNAYQLCSQIKTVYLYSQVSVALLLNSTYFAHVYTLFESITPPGSERIAPLLLRQFGVVERRKRDDGEGNWD